MPDLSCDIQERSGIPSAASGGGDELAALPSREAGDAVLPARLRPKGTRMFPVYHRKDLARCLHPLIPMRP